MSYARFCFLSAVLVKTSIGQLYDLPEASSGHQIVRRVADEARSKFVVFDARVECASHDSSGIGRRGHANLRQPLGFAARKCDDITRVDTGLRPGVLAHDSALDNLDAL
jgi:hypothetical protein